MPIEKKRKVDDSGSSSELSNSSPTTPNKPRLPKKLSCQRCRLRKMRCDFNSPCSNCTAMKLECVETTQDLRKKRPPATYVKTLESQVSNIKSFIESLQRLKNTEEQLGLLKNTDLSGILDGSSLDPLLSQQQEQQQQQQQQQHDHHEQNDDVDETKAIYGPTSVYNSTIITSNGNISNKNPSSKRELEVKSIKDLNKDPEILQCIHLFFTWQYPDHNMFIFREAFLFDFFNPTLTSMYCSKVLVLSICALGSRMSLDEKIYKKSKDFYKDAKSLLLNSISQPSITSLQSFMLLAFFDICNGSNSSGWMLSGNAMRMGFDIGFQLNPEVWFVKSKESLNKLDVEIRSRIYWGCYMADHFISLVLGRPSILKLSDASIPETSDLPDLEWIDDFTYNGYIKNKGSSSKRRKPPAEISRTTYTAKVESYISDPLNQIINLINISDNMLNDIFTKSDLEHEKANNTNDDLNLGSRLGKVFDYNWQIMRWKENLPGDLQWNRRALIETGENPAYSGIRYYYYILILCLNRPFIGLESETFPTNNHLSPKSICLSAIDDLYESVNKFETEHGYKRASIFIVYASILSISIILLTNSTISQSNEYSERLQFFMGVLRGCSRTWKLAEKSHNLIKEKLKRSYDSEDLKIIRSQGEEMLRNTIRNAPSSIASTTATTNDLTTNANNAITTKKNGNDNGDKKNANAARPSTSIGSVSSIDNSSAVKPSPISSESYSITNPDFLLDDNIDFLGGPPVLMTSDLFNEDWESLFPDYIFHSKN
ncbi:uncharacterized protein LODBEIA_P33560 [Lodderomyces beijingensis]|uniref:Zn(2)-C6 fungal-type domain-containing protein n=1 Tax=Lodderomyces beijingensis TaxID=1775926 RepID=A0ABP0ZLX1_9ASCO